MNGLCWVCWPYFSVTFRDWKPDLHWLRRVGTQGAQRVRAARPHRSKTWRLLILSCAYMGACCVLAQRWGDLVTVSLLTRTKVRTGSIRPRASAAHVLPLNPSVVWPNECLYWAACPALSGMNTVRRLVCTYRLTAPQPVRAADPYNVGGAFLCFGAAQSAASNSA